MLGKDAEGEEHHRQNQQLALKMHEDGGFRPGKEEPEVGGLPGEPEHREGAAGHAQGREDDHGDGAGLEQGIGQVDGVGVGDEDGVHVEDFHHGAHHEGMDRGGALSVIHPSAQGGGQEARQAGGDAAGPPGEPADGPDLAQDEALHAADEARQNAREGIKEETGGQGGDIPHIQDAAHVFNAQMVGGHGAEAVEQPDAHPEGGGHLPAAQKKAYQSGHPDIQQGGREHSQEHFRR